MGQIHRSLDIWVNTIFIWSEMLQMLSRHGEKVLSPHTISDT